MCAFGSPLKPISEFPQGVDNPMHPLPRLLVDEVPVSVKRRRVTKDVDEQLWLVDKMQVQEDAHL